MSRMLKVCDRRLSTGTTPPMHRHNRSTELPAVEAQRPRSTRAHSALIMAAGLAAGLVLFTAGCSQQITKRGAQFRDTDIQQVQVGMGQEQVRMILGTPSTTSTIGDGQAYYYISSIEKQAAFFKPSEVDRQVLAVYFTPTAMVDRVANYGLKDGKVFDYSSRTTPAPGGREDGILKSLFRNLGQKQIFGE